MLSAILIGFLIYLAVSVLVAIIANKCSWAPRWLVWLHALDWTVLCCILTPRSVLRAYREERERPARLAQQAERAEWACRVQQARNEALAWRARYIELRDDYDSRLTIGEQQQAWQRREEARKRINAEYGVGNE